MQPESHGKMLIHMEQGASGEWNVSKVGDCAPLASFTDIEKCVDYASNVAKENNGIVVQMFY